MSQPATPEQVVRAVAAGVGALVAGNLPEPEREQQVDRLAGLYAEHTNVRHPLAPLGDTPLRTRAELRRHFAGAPSTPGINRFEAVGQVHRTDDPEVVIFEFRYEGSMNGRPFALPCVFVTRVRDGVIIESRDYGDHIGLARVFGHIHALATALADNPDQKLGH